MTPEAARVLWCRKRLVLRSIAVLAAILGLSAVLGGCGGAAKATASCSLYSHRWKTYAVFRGRPVSRAVCGKLGRDLGPAAFGVVNGESNYAADKRVCVVHGSGGEMDAYVDVHAAHSEQVARLVCKFIARAYRIHLPGG